MNDKMYRTTTPIALYEANYRRLFRIIPELDKIPASGVIYLPRAKLVVSIQEQHKYTTLGSLKQSLEPITLERTSLEQHTFSTPTQISRHKHLLAIDMDLRICHDAGLVEVIGYQGKTPIQSALTYPNKHMMQIDEKKQLNTLLKEILENTLKKEHHPVDSISQCN